MTRHASLALLALLVLAAPGQTLATHPQQCPDGTYLVEGPPLLPPLNSTSSALQRDAIMIDQGTVSIASGCEAVPASIRPRRDGGWTLHARWERCKNAKRVHLRAKISPGCGEMSGLVVTHRPRTIRRFTASQCEIPGGCDGICRDNSQCADTDYCSKPLGACADAGRCASRPQACPDVWLPVCGCDGQTYGNACEAAAAGASVAHLGRCDRRCDVTLPCDPGQFCEMRPGICASALDAGMCVDVPEVCPNDICGNCQGGICPLCPTIYRPVCGCDGKTYPSDCERRKAQVQKSHDGPCLCPQILCAPGTEPVDRNGDGCAESCLAPCRTVCDCKNNPDIGLRNDCPMLCPTCGDHWTCQQGHCVEECGPTPPDECRRCGGFAGFPCRPGEVCDLPPGTCGWADLFGECRQVGDACIALWDPVCGCDGVTYGNDCERLRAGAQLDHRGECKR
jgi:hypothetical protein